MPKRPAIVVVGCGRSGTKYITKVFKRMGIHVGHEAGGPDGVASWYITPGLCAPKALFKKDIPFKRLKATYGEFTVIHQVRNPVNCISSAQTFSSASWEYIAQFVDIDMTNPLIWRCLQYWECWNAMAEEIAAHRFRVEDLEEHHKELFVACNIQKWDSNIKFIFQNKEENTRKRFYTKYSWEQLVEVDKDLAQKIKERALRYGYNL